MGISRYDPNNFCINKVFDELDKRMKKKKKVKAIKVEKTPSKPEVCDGPLVIEINV